MAHGTSGGAADATDGAPGGAAGGAVTWDERWWPAPGSWASSLVVVAGAALVPLPIWGTAAALAGAVLGALVSAAVLLSLATRTRLEDGAFHVGRARLPLEVVSGVDPVLPAQRRAALGTQLDARAHLAIRSWVPGAVRVHLDDPRDPAPYWMVSTRRPRELAAALSAAAAAAR
ncbi:DUF3093 domain-containing protein [Kineococcus terrestris]|uniref:DUF3093 domain-containing protein n=1 Tax=Kineococcus terrestris TaxID=2044856 RepID=UPI0034DB59D3